MMLSYHMKPNSMKEYKFELRVKEGSYYADTFWKLIIEVLSHRFWHLRKHGKWMD